MSYSDESFDKVLNHLTAKTNKRNLVMVERMVLLWLCKKRVDSYPAKDGPQTWNKTTHHNFCKFVAEKGLATIKEVKGEEGKHTLIFSWTEIGLEKIKNEFSKILQNLPIKNKKNTGVPQVAISGNPETVDALRLMVAQLQLDLQNTKEEAIQDYKRQELRIMSLKKRVAELELELSECEEYEEDPNLFKENQRLREILKRVIAERLNGSGITSNDLDFIL